MPDQSIWPAAGVPANPARAYRAAAQNLAAGVPTKVALDTVTFDVAGAIALANSRFIAPATGYYHVDGNVAVATSAANNYLYAALLYKNGAQWSAGGQIEIFTQGFNLHMPLSDVVPLNAADYLELFGFAQIGVALADLGPASNYLTVERIA